MSSFPIIGDVSFTNINKNADLIHQDSDNFSYFFVNSFNATSPQGECTNSQDIINFS
jgi:hypothetical protein